MNELYFPTILKLFGIKKIIADILRQSCYYLSEDT